MLFEVLKSVSVIVLIFVGFCQQVLHSSECVDLVIFSCFFMCNIHFISEIDEKKNPGWYDVLLVAFHCYLSERHSGVCVCIHSKVSSVWLPSYIKATESVLKIFTGYVHIHTHTHTHTHTHILLLCWNKYITIREQIYRISVLYNS